MARSWPRLICVWTVVFVACSSFLPRPSELHSVSRWEAPKSRPEPGFPPLPSSPGPRCFTPQRRHSGVWLKHDIPSQQAEEDTKCYLFVLSQSFQRHGCAPSIQSSLPLYFSFSLCRLDRIIVAPAFINGDRLVARFIFGAVCPGILAFYPLEGEKKNRLNRCFWHFVWCFPHRSCSWDMLWEVKVGFSATVDLKKKSFVSLKSKHPYSVCLKGTEMFMHLVCFPNVVLAWRAMAERLLSRTGIFFLNSFPQ